MVLPSTEKRVTIVDGSPEHLEPLLARVRAEDRAEWVCGTGQGLRLCLAYAIERGEKVRVALDPEGNPILCWGYDPASDFTSGMAYAHPTISSWRGVWLLATTDAPRYIVAFHRVLDEELSRLAEGRGLFCLADSRNDLHLRWLRRIGFTQGPSLPMGPFDFDFTLFWRQPPCVPQSSV
jgi:hypothetical protein